MQELERTLLIILASFQALDSRNDQRTLLTPTRLPSFGEQDKTACIEDSPTESSSNYR